MIALAPKNSSFSLFLSQRFAPMPLYLKNNPFFFSLKKICTDAYLCDFANTSSPLSGFIKTDQNCDQFKHLNHFITTITVLITSVHGAQPRDGDGLLRQTTKLHRCWLQFRPGHILVNDICLIFFHPGLLVG